MIYTERRIQVLTVCLAAVAGYVDAIGFVSLGGFFVSFMSGNSTRFGVGFADSSHAALVALGLIATFVAGVASGSLMRSFFKAAPSAAVMWQVCILLICAAALGELGVVVAAAIAMTLAMGSENTIFERDGEVRIGLTYLTGTLVKLGQRLAAFLRGEKNVKWLPYFFHWAGLVTGAVVGATFYARIGFSALLVAAGGMAVLAFFTLKAEG